MLRASFDTHVYSAQYYEGINLFLYDGENNNVKT